MVTEHLLQAEFGRDEEEPLVEVIVPTALNSCLLEDLVEVVFKLRAFTESAENDENFSLGFELGMQRAADMIENVISRHNQQGD